MENEIVVKTKLDRLSRMWTKGRLETATALGSESDQPM